MILDFIKGIEESISLSTIVLSSNIQKYFSSSKKEAYIKGSLIFMNLSSLEFAIYVLERGKRLVFDKYRYQCMDSEKRLIFRYDNTAHHKDISTFPLHKHLRDGKVIESSIPEFQEILEEIITFIAQSTA